MTSDSILEKGIGIHIYNYRDKRMSAHLDEIRSDSILEEAKQLEKCGDRVPWV